MRIRWRNLRFAFAVVFSSSALGTELEKPVDTPAEAVKKAENFEFSNPLIGGGLIVVFENGDIAYSGLGSFRSRDSSEEIKDYPFRAGSVSKLVTALMAARLVDSGLVSWQGKVGERFPDWFETSFEDSPVTLAHLFEHTAGLEGSVFADYGQAAPDASPARYIEDRGPFALRWKPGTHYSYANGGAVLAARYLEVAAESDFDSLMQRKVFDPLRMDSSSYLQSSASLPTSFSTSGEVIETPWLLSVRPAGALVSTLRDLGQVVLMFLRDGRGPDGEVFLEESTLERMERGETSLAALVGAEDAVYGIGQFPFVIDGRVFRGHWGRIDGFQTTLGYCRETGRGFVLWINSANRRDMRELRSIMVAALKNSDPIPTSGDNLGEGNISASSAGIYRNFTHDMRVRAGLFGLLGAVRIDARDGELTVRGVWPWNPSESVWVQEGKGVFQMTGFPLATGVLVEEQGKTNWIDGESWRRTSTVLFWVEAVALFGGIFVLAVGSLCFPVFVIWRVMLAVFSRAAPFREGTKFLPWLGITLSSCTGLLFLLSFVSWGIFGGTGDMAKLARPTPEALFLATSSVVGPFLAAILVVRWKYLSGFQRVLVLGQVAFWIEMAILGMIPLFSWL